MLIPDKDTQRSDNAGLYAALFEDRAYHHGSSGLTLCAGYADGRKGIARIAEIFC